MDMQGKMLTKDIKKSHSINKNINYGAIMNYKKASVHSTQTSVWDLISDLKKICSLFELFISTGIAARFLGPHRG
jgi:hypothetical protein